MIDLRSDTATRPSVAMRRFMAEAEVGDEQIHEDPTVIRLQDLVASLTGKEAALFLPSGTMCNAIALAVHCRRGEAVILDRTAHPNTSEGGGPAVIAGVLLRVVEGERGVFSAEQAERFIHRGNMHASRTTLISVENTSNQGGGKIWPLSMLADLRALANQHGLMMHMDGARLMNASVGSATPVSAFASQVDSVWIDLSKGLGAPVGAVLAGSAEFIDEARLWKHRLGGAMRQAGIIAAAGVYAFEHNVERLAEDHANAKLLEQGLSDIPGIELTRGPVETNIIIFKVQGTGLSNAEFCRHLVDEHGVRMSPYIDQTCVRAVTHLDVSRQDCERAIEAVGAVATARLQIA